MSIRPIDQLGQLQRQVLEILWTLEEGTVRQVLEHIAPKKDLAYTTILTTLQTLEKNGWCKHRKHGKTYVYRPARSRQQASAKSLKTLIKGVFNNDPLAMVQHLMDDEQLSDDQLESLRHMIETKRKERKDGCTSQ